jgi:hypothetical protein
MVRDWEMRVLQRLYIDFYLNERLALTEWARQHGCVLVRLPSVRGNRQTVNLEITKAILANVRAPFLTCTSAPGGRGCAKNPAAPRGCGCAKNPADRKFTLSSRFAFHQGSGDCSAITVFDMGEFVLLALAYSFAPLILLLLLLLLLLRAFFLALSVLLTAAFHQRSLY